MVKLPAQAPVLADSVGRSRTSTLHRAFTILSVLPVGQGLRLAQVAELADLPKPTTHRILQALIDLGQAAQDRDGTYSSLGRLASQADPGANAVRAAAMPLLRVLHRRFNETVNLALLEGERIRYIHVLETTRPLRLMATPNPTDAIHTTALGRAILGQLGPDRARGLLADRLPSRELARVLALAVEAAERGFAEESGETEPGVACLAVALHGPWRSPAAISITVPLARLDAPRRAAMVAALREVAP